jgi:hypothetical protein
VAAEDPLVHFARFFYGPMLQGRDGVGAAPCCGAGVVFRRDVLVSIGGQAYGSITEVSVDCTDNGDQATGGSLDRHCWCCSSCHLDAWMRFFDSQPDCGNMRPNHAKWVRM